MPTRLSSSTWIVTHSLLVFSLFALSYPLSAEEGSSIDESVIESSPQTETGLAAELEIEEVYVTGSLLPRGNYVSNAPITTIDSDQFEISNVVNVEALLNTLPQVLAGSDRTSTFGFGWATADLRGLGENRTLTLLDGKRVVPTFADGGTVDLNLIPPGMIDRVEILTGGASTTYGSDAMAGVINLITKSDVQGFELSAAGESTAVGDSQIYNLAGTWGSFFGDDRGHVMVHLDLSKRRGLSYQDREFSREFNTEAFDANGNTTGIENFRFPVGEAGTLTFFGMGPDLKFSPQGELLPFDQVVDGYSPPQDLSLQLPQEREVLFAKSYWQGDTFEIRAQAHIANSSLDRTQFKVPVGWYSLSGPAAITLEGNPFLSESAINTLAANPLVQNFGFDADGNGIPDIANLFAGTVLGDLGPTQWNQEYALQQYEIGITYDIGDMWSLDAYVNHGEIDLDWQATPVLDVPRFRQALLVDVSDQTGQTCMDPSNGCAPVNIFGPGLLSQAAIDFISTDINAVNVSKILTANAVLTGNTADFFEMPGGAGPLGVAVGLEYMKREQTFIIDERATNNDYQYVGFFPAAIDRELARKSLFVELVIPLLQDLPLVSFAEMELAARYTDHETVGGTTSWKAAVSWYPIEDLQVRTSLNQAVRAPSINDLYLDFGDQDLLTPPTFLDPCSAAGFDGSASVEALCIATGVPADRVGSADLNVTAQGIPGYYGGNAETQEETGNTLTVGLVWTPYSIEGLSASIDYFDIEVEDYIGRLPGNARTQITQCYFPENGTAEANAYCAAAERDVAGVLTRVNAGNTNIATHSINGFDFAINKSSEFLGGVLDASYVASYIREKKYSVDGTDLAVDCAGKFNVSLGGNACARPVTNLKHRATLFWSRDAYSLQLTWRHLSSVDDGNEDLTYTFEKISAYDTVDLGGVYEFQNGFTLIAGVRNLLDKSPPILGENSFEANTYPNLYDLFGRTIYARATYSL